MWTTLSVALALPVAFADSHADCNASCGTDFDTCVEQSDAQRDDECSPLQWSSADWAEGQAAKESCRQQLTPVYYSACADALGVCYEACAEGYGSSTSGASMVLEDCPEGTTASPLGTCLPNFGQSPEETDPDDGCPAGYAPGPDDACVPVIELVPADVVVRVDETGFLICPDGMVPGPVGGCVVDTFDPEYEPEQCPPGFVGGPDGQCVPNRGADFGRMILGRAVRGLEAVGVDAELASELLESWGVAEVEDVREAIAQVESEWR